MKDEYLRVGARVEIRESAIVYEYEFEGKLYEVQTPKTDNNEHLKDGDMVVLKLGIVLIK